MNAWRILYEYTFGAYPDDTGMLTKFFPTIKGGEFPYDDEGVDGDGFDATNTHDLNHDVPIPQDTRHTAWDPNHDGDGQDIDEVEGSPFLIGKDSGTTGQNPSDPNYGNGEAPREVDDDELEKDGRDVKESIGDQVDDLDKNWNMNDDELTNFVKDMDSDQDPTDYPGTDAPSDIMTIATGGAFTMGLGHDKNGRGDLYGIRDSVEGELPGRNVWKYLESLIVKEISRKK